MRGQLIDPAEAIAPADVVRRMVALQAQDFGQALWAIGVRAIGARANGRGRTDALAALDRGEIVRTLPMRGTLHWVAPEDLRWMLSLTAARSLQSTATRFRQLGLDQPTFDRAEAVTHDALVGGRSLSREQFMNLMTENGISPDGQRGYHLIFYLTQRVLVCWGPTSGTQQALVLVDEWIPKTEAPDPEEALQGWAMRYFASHGPATERDFAWWTKLPLRDIRAAIQTLGDQLTTLTANGTDYLIASEALAAGIPTSVPTGVHALPGFDEYLLGYQDRTPVLDDDHAWKVVPGNNGIFFPTIVANGRIVGSWRRNAKTKLPEPDHFVEAKQTALAGFAKAAKRYERFMAS